MVDHFCLNWKILPSSKWLQVSERCSPLRQLAKISLFLPFYAAEKNFLLSQKDFFSETNAKCFEKKDSNLRLFQFFIWNCLKSIFGQIPEIYKKTKRYNCRYSSDGTSCVNPVFSVDSLCGHNTMWSNPQHCPGNHPYTGEIRIDQIRKKSQNCNPGNNP